MPEVGEQGGHGVLSASPKSQDIASLDTHPEVAAGKPVIIATACTSHYAATPARP